MPPPQRSRVGAVNNYNGARDREEQYRAGEGGGGRCKAGNTEPVREARGREVYGKRAEEEEEREGEQTRREDGVGVV